MSKSVSLVCALLLSILVSSAAFGQPAMTVTSHLESPREGDVYRVGSGGVLDLQIASDHTTIMTGVSGTVTIVLYAQNGVESLGAANTFNGTRSLTQDSSGVYGDVYFSGPGQPGYNSMGVPFGTWNAFAYTRSTYSASPPMIKDDTVTNSFSVVF